MTHPKLYHYVRSSASYRVRIALNLKHINYEMIPISLLQNEQNSPEYLKINPQGLVPAWVDEDITLSQSLAIIEYLEEKHPHPRLLPENKIIKAHARQFSFIIACDIHPLNNLGVRNYLSDHDWKQTEIQQWIHHWLNKGFTAYEKLLKQYDFGNFYTLNQSLSIADICLIPQVYNALRFEFDMQAYPKIMQIYRNANLLEAFKKAAPDE